MYLHVHLHNIMIFQWRIATEADEDLSKLSTDLISLQNSSSEETIKVGLENSVKLCEQVLQKVQQADTEREQAVIYNCCSKKRSWLSSRNSLRLLNEQVNTIALVYMFPFRGKIALGLEWGLNTHSYLRCDALPIELQ